MSWKASGYVKEITGVSRSEKLLLMLLGDYYDESRGWAWPGIERLAREAMLSERHTLRLIQSLERKGVIQVLRSEGIVNRYRFPGYGGTPDTMSPVTSDVTPPVTSDVTRADNEPSRMMMMSSRDLYRDIVDQTGTISGVHTEKYWDSPQDDWQAHTDPEAVKEAVTWIQKALEPAGPMTLPTPTFLPALSRLGEYVRRRKVSPISWPIMDVVGDQDKVQERILYGVSKQVGQLIGELR